MTADPRALAELLEESQDLQADALRPTHEALDELVDTAHAQPEDDPAANQAFHETHTRALTSSLAGAVLLGAAGGAVLVGALASAAAASSSSDVQILQTAASIENLAVSTYKTALTLPYIGGSSANPVVTKFAQVTMGQHAQHADAFNAAVEEPGRQGAAQARPGLRPGGQEGGGGPRLGHAGPGRARRRGAGPRAREHRGRDLRQGHRPGQGHDEQGLAGQHHGDRGAARPVLLAVQALLMAGAPQLISLSPGTAAMLPAAAGSVGFPNAFYKTNSAAPAGQGAVK